MARSYICRLSLFSDPFPITYRPNKFGSAHLAASPLVGVRIIYMRKRCRAIAASGSVAVSPVPVVLGVLPALVGAL